MPALLRGPFSIWMRLYWPKPKALDGTWKQPQMQRVKQDGNLRLFNYNYAA